jgi:hypothetical protein
MVVLFPKCLKIVLSLARAAMLTGRLPIRNGFYTDNDRGRNGEILRKIVDFEFGWHVLKNYFR